MQSVFLRRHLLFPLSLLERCFFTFLAIVRFLLSHISPLVSLLHSLFFLSHLSPLASRSSRINLHSPLVFLPIVSRVFLLALASRSSRVSLLTLASRLLRLASLFFLSQATPSLSSRVSFSCLSSLASLFVLLATRFFYLTFSFLLLLLPLFSLSSSPSFSLHSLLNSYLFPLASRFFLLTSCSILPTSHIHPQP